MAEQLTDLENKVLPDLPCMVSTSAWIYPRYAAFGDGYNKWEVCILWGKRKVDSIFSISLDQARTIEAKARGKRAKTREEAGKEPEESREPLKDSEAYIFAKKVVLAELKRLESLNG